jgi:hypothetical protein
MLRLQKQRRRPSLSNPALETLAIVAYRQPITRGEIEAIRGVDSSGALRALQDMGLVEIGGRKDVVGRPSLFITTGVFLSTFGLMSIQELPPLAELRQAGKEADGFKPASTESEVRSTPLLVDPPVTPESSQLPDGVKPDGDKPNDDLPQSAEPIRSKRADDSREVNGGRSTLV